MAEAECDLVVRGGTVVMAGGSRLADVGVRDGKIAQLGGPMRGRAEIDAAGALVLPGGIDMHVHLSPGGPPEPGEPDWADDFGSGSRAAIARGITTVGNMTFPWDGQSLRQALDRDLAAAAGAAAVDYVLHPVLDRPSPAAVAELPGLAADGHTSLKVFMVDPAFDERLDDAIAAIAAAGRDGMLTLLHCEDAALVRFAGQELLAAGQGGLASWGWRGRGTRGAGRRRPGRGYLRGHRGTRSTSCTCPPAPALGSARRAQAAGLPVFVETRPVYLHLTSAVLQGAGRGEYIGSPPLREPGDVAALWAALADGTVHTLGSDHAPWRLADKTDPALDVTTARQGVADLETALPMLYCAGVVTGRISLPRFRVADLPPRSHCSACTRARARSPSAATPTWWSWTRSCAAGWTAGRCSRGRATRSTTAGRSPAGRGSRSAGARSSWTAARSRPGPAAGSGCAAAPPQAP